MKHQHTRLPGLLLTRWKNLLAGAGLAVTLAPLAAHAQVGQEAAQPNRVIVTGSYLPTAEGEGPLPVQTFTQDDLQKLLPTTPVEGLRKLPSFVGSTLTENANNGTNGTGTGTANINLRALGAQNTLVLINGRRAEDFNDLNLIPLSIIDHVEVLKDGASATYGSEAVAGVVNFITRTEFNGTQTSFLYGNTTSHDEAQYQAWAITGYHNDRLNMVFSGLYNYRDGLYRRDRSLTSSIDERSRGGIFTGGSSNYGGRVDSNTLGALVLINVGSNAPTGPNSYRAYDPSGDQFNTERYNPLAPSEEFWEYYGALDYQIVPKILDVYGYGLYSNTRVFNELAPAPLFIPGATGQSSPFNPLGTDLANVRYRSFELGTRQVRTDNKAYYGTFGLRGDVPIPGGDFLKSFHYDMASWHSEETSRQSGNHGVTNSILTNEIAAGQFNPFVGYLSSARAGVAPTFDANGNPTGTAAYDNVAALRRATYNYQSVTFDSTNAGDGRFSLTLLPDAPQGGVSIAFGGEYRGLHLGERPSPILVAGDNFGEYNALQPYNANEYILSAFGEVNFPIVTPNMKVPGIYNLAFTVAGRYQKYYLDGVNPVTGQRVFPTFQTTNPKFAFRYQPIPDITLRGSYSTAFRAPLLSDLFATPGTDFPEITDPKNGNQTYQPQNGDPTSGNPNLQPERTDSYSLGIVLSPRFAPGLNITADYYQINQKNVIISAGTVAQFYVNQNAINGSFANLVVRDPATGLLNSVSEVPFNAARRGIEGLDVTANYTLDTNEAFHHDLGKFLFTLSYNHFFRFNAAVSSTSGFTNFLGKFSNAPLTPGSVPINRALFVLEYQYRGFDFVSTVNYTGDYADDGGKVNKSQLIVNPVTGQPPDGANPTYTRNRRVREYLTLDLQLSYTYTAPGSTVAPASKEGKDSKGKNVVTNAAAGVPVSLWQKILNGTTVTVGCNNVADTEPPFAAGADEGNYDEALYNIRNRFLYVQLSKKF